MSVELLGERPLLSRRRGAERRPGPAGLRRVVAVLGESCTSAQAAWLRTHLSDLPAGVEPWAAATLPASSSPRGEPRGLDPAAAALAGPGRPVQRRLLVGDADLALEELSGGGVALPVLLDEGAGPLARWGLRRAGVPVLVLPPRAPAGPASALLLARDPGEVARLADCALLLPRGCPVWLHGVARGLTAPSPLRAWRAACELEAALQAAAARLEAAGLAVQTRLSAVAPRPARATLLLLPASRGPLRRLWPGAAERSLRRVPIPVLTVPCPAPA